jgi:hypothetical protein
MQIPVEASQWSSTLAQLLHMAVGAVQFPALQIRGYVQFAHVRFWVRMHVCVDGSQTTLGAVPQQIVFWQESPTWAQLEDVPGARQI